jgi:hypothetical protein
VKHAVLACDPSAEEDGAVSTPEDDAARARAIFERLRGGAEVVPASSPGVDEVEEPGEAPPSPAPQAHSVDDVAGPEGDPVFPHPGGWRPASAPHPGADDIAGPEGDPFEPLEQLGDAAEAGAAGALPASVAGDETRPPPGELRLRQGGFEIPPDGMELPVLGRGHLLGRFVLDPQPLTGVSLEERVVAVAVADQVGAVLAAGTLTAGS